MTQRAEHDRRDVAHGHEGGVVPGGAHQRHRALKQCDGKGEDEGEQPDLAGHRTPGPGSDPPGSGWRTLLRVRAVIRNTRKADWRGTPGPGMPGET